MKKIISTVLLSLTLALGFTFAQTQKGKILIGSSSSLLNLNSTTALGGVSFGKIKSKSDANGYNEPQPDKLLSFNLQPKAAYFVVDNLAIGVKTFFYIFNQTDGTSDDKYKNSFFTAGPYVRYYIPAGKVLPFIEAGSTYGISIYKTDYKDNTFYDDFVSKTDIFNWNLGAGLAIPLGERVCFDTFISYNYLWMKDKENNPDNDRTTYGTIGLDLGFTIMLGK